MIRNVSVQAYLPTHVVAWVDSQAKLAKVSRSHWIASILLDLFQGQELREEGRAVAKRTDKQLTFIICAVDGLLALHPDATLRERVHKAYRKKVVPEGGEAEA
jgi:hypothetical protein